MILTVLVFLVTVAVAVFSCRSSYGIAAAFERGELIQASTPDAKTTGARAASYVRVWTPIVLALDLTMALLSPAVNAWPIPEPFGIGWAVLGLLNLMAKAFNGVALVRWSPRSGRTWKVVGFYFVSLALFAVAAYGSAH